MKTYAITWTIDEIDADSPREAAEKAREIQLDPTSIATVFVVIDGDDTETTVDLDADDDEPTYKIQRMYFSDDWDTETIKTGLTLDEAQEWCNDPETSWSTATSAEAVARTHERGTWFDGYQDESR